MIHTKRGTAMQGWAADRTDLQIRAYQSMVEDDIPNRASADPNLSTSPNINTGDRSRVDVTGS